MSKFFDTDGKPFEKEGYIPPVVLLEEKIDGFEAGWYHCDEGEQLNGPFGTIEEAIEAFKLYCKTL